MIKIADHLWVDAIGEEETLRPLVTPEDRARVETITSARRRREWLSWRALLYRQVGQLPITYTDYGAPLLPAGQGYIGVSHNARRVALCYSPWGPCAVDLDSSERRFEAVRSRYLNPTEEQLSAHPAWLCIAWCAKECLYKLARRTGLDLRRDLRLEAPEFGANGTEGILVGHLPDRSYRLRFCCIEKDWLVWYSPEEPTQTSQPK